jgi:AraC-like DNA-binding protein
VRCEDVDELFGRTIGEGYSDFIQLNDDLCARVVNARVAVPTGMRCPGEDWLKIEVYTSGRQSLVFEDVGQIDLERRWCHLHLHPEGLAKGDWMGEGVHGKGLILYLKPTFFGTHVAEDFERLPPALHRFMTGGTREFFFETLPVPSQMALAVNDVLATRLLGGLRRIYMEAKALDIVVSVIDMLSRGEHATRSPVLFNARDVERLHHARSVIEREFADPPRIADLARRVGINQQKLKCGFKALFGMTIFECYQDKRLSVAAEMLQNQGASVGAAALAAGYEYASNFALAFKRKFGAPPRQFKSRPR